ncbi:MAG: efflux RND transporter periplasmic adaptor subunit [Nitrospirae bacterium]|nr:MAG: efflux RND transporter periplasmic adaptor subunit [Nitrospirota bacterium]
MRLFRLLGSPPAFRRIARWRAAFAGITRNFGVLLLLGIFLTGSLSACNEQQAAPPPKRRPPMPVRVAPIVKQRVQHTVTLVGTVEPWKRSVVASEIAGVVEQFPVEAGMAVARGDLLARLRTETLRIRLDSALAAHREARTRHLQAKLDLVRIKTLFDKELVTQKEYDDAVANEAALRERLSQLQAEIRQVRDLLAKSRIVAPYDGLITETFTEVGQWVEAGGPVVEMVDLTKVKVQVPLPERYVQGVRVGDPVTATFDGLPGFKANGRVFSVVAQADRVARTFPVHIELPNPHGTIKSGMVARVTLAVGTPHEGLVVPKDALVLRGDQTFLFVVHDGTVRQVHVEPRLPVDGFVEVQGETLAEGHQVVVEGNERLFPGQPIRILDESPPRRS